MRIKNSGPCDSCALATKGRLLNPRAVGTGKVRYLSVSHQVHSGRHGAPRAAPAPPSSSTLLFPTCRILPFTVNTMKADGACLVSEMPAHGGHAAPLYRTRADRWPRTRFGVHPISWCLSPIIPLILGRCLGTFRLRLNQRVQIATWLSDL